MAEYIDKMEVLNKLQGRKTIELVRDIKPADVIKRVEYEKLKKENEELKNILADKSVLEEDGYYKTSCNLIKKVWDMDFKMQEIEHSKIDKAIKELERYSTSFEYANRHDLADAVDYCIGIIQGNIGE